MAKKAAAQVTPMMRQYLEMKEQYPDCLLFFRLGDFYELFFDDAVTASRELEIVLTGRNCGLEERAPMCGVPFHAVDSYVDKLIQKGYKVAICEQLEDPKQATNLVDRGVIRIVTPGTVTDESALDEKTNNFIMAVCLDEKENLGFSVADVSTGAYSLGQIEGKSFETRLMEELARIQPTEIIYNSPLEKRGELMKRLKTRYYVYPYGDWAFETETAKKNILSHFGLMNLDRFECADLPAGIGAAGALLAYLSETQKNTLAHISDLKVDRRRDYMVLDETTRRNLELTQSLRADRGKRGTLLGLLDKTETAMGGRMLRQWIIQPLSDIRAAQRRLDAVSALKDDILLRESLRQSLGKIYDLERLCSRLAYGTLNARDALSLKQSLSVLPALKKDLAQGGEVLEGLGSRLDTLEDIEQLLEEAVALEPPAVITEGNIIRSGYHAEIDQLREAAEQGKNWLEKLEEKEREATGIKNLRVNFNRVFGYYIEVTKSYLSQVPLRYQRKQTLANAERYITPELKELEDKILGAQERSVALEYQVFCGLRELLCNHIERIQKAARIAAELDCYQSLAEVAAQYNYFRPTLTEGDRLSIKAGRHPVVERTAQGFVPNDTLLDCGENRLLIITGPNMAGKSTYMRQVALITLMAHIGSFVPAAETEIPLTDRIFTRVGASDDLAFGQSTFMVEMSETANILQNATSKSLLLLDEIGRGTSTFDGLSIAWAVVEHISDRQKIGAKTLFATHYHELSELEGLIPGVVNYRITAREMGEEIIFLRKVVRGGTDKSYGIQVARLAGIPQEVIDRAKEILQQLEAAEINRAIETRERPKPLAPDLSLALLKELSGLNVDALSPLEGLSLLYELQHKAKVALGEQLI